MTNGKWKMINNSPALLFVIFHFPFSIFHLPNPLSVHPFALRVRPAVAVLLASLICSSFLPAQTELVQSHFFPADLEFVELRAVVSERELTEVNSLNELPEAALIA